MANKKLHSAKDAKNDEFYTQYVDIQNEVNAYLEYNSDVFKDKVILLPCDDPEWSNFTKFFAQNFERFGIKKLISTSYSNECKKEKYGNYYQFSFSDYESDKYDVIKEEANGKIFTLTRHTDDSGNIDYDDLEWDYLEGNGDFRSAEVKALRSEADIIVTNPPFSLYREFIDWLFEEDKKFLIIGSMNSVTYNEIFPLLRDNKMWIGNGFKGGNAYFETPTAENYGAGVFYKELNLVKFRNVNWFTNLDHGRRHEPLGLMTMEDNLRYNNRLINKLKEDYKSESYPKYENYDAIETPFTNAIPSDYKGVMGVPISFLSKYNPDQFEILGLGISNSGLEAGVEPYKAEHKKFRREVQKRGAVDGDLYMMIEGEVVVPYARILIKHRR